VDKYFKTIQGVKWYFAVPVKNRTGHIITYSLTKLATIPIERHVKVNGTASPDDPTLNTYWKHRQTQQGRTYWHKGSKHYQVAESQNLQCPVCGEHMFNGEQLQIHHVMRVADGGTNRVDNLLHLHKTCHHHLHTGKQPDKQKD